MRANLSLGLVLLAAGLCAEPACAFWSDEHLELLEVAEVVDEFGLMVFTGTIQNTHTTQAIDTVSIYVVLKKEGRIVAIYRGWPDRSSGGIGPSETQSFSIETDYAEGEYDEFNVRLEGTLDAPDASLVTGELTIVEESLNLTTSPEGQTVIYGELFNGTNALIREINIQFTLLDARGDVIGFALPSLLSISLKYTDLWPNEKIDFSATSTVSLNRVKSWEVEIEFEAIRVVESDAPTVSTSTTWGQIKHGIGGEE